MIMCGPFRTRDRRS